MSAPATTRPVPAPAAGRPRELTSDTNARHGQWLRFALLSVITAIVLVPVAAVFILALQPPVATGGSIGFDSFTYVLTQTAALHWLGNSLWVTLITVIAAVVVAAPAGYVVSRGRNRLVAGYSLLLFVVQSLPVIVSVIPLFILFANLGLADSLTGVTIIYVGGTLSVATWMMAAYFDSIPISLEEAAWMDGCSVFGSFLRVVLRNSLPGVLSTAIFSFLVCWNDYLIAVIFLRSNNHFTLPVGLQTFFQQNATDWGPVMAVAVIMVLPPIIVFGCLNRYFSVGGIGGSLAGQ
ncbi:multiple sugar transport system permease protein [Pseudarthrobacter siccitolerans]|uniref:Multiple sugar transport system permease protein n=1 Tax=Pseudarthrobacter siccitolerans TaxID=861266 RepID=A0ABU0PME4_9MICC|nr:carbohydrate ABC transporter permease [Pseudarthrobacter siccitolerans]MDQ0675150.1 multiple sugar transport system permease protein [Pseudarthrobacter siccitolerans]